MPGTDGRRWHVDWPALHERIVGRRVDCASLAAFRILFGLLLAVGAVRFLALGWVEEFYVRPRFHFAWELFPWVQPLPAGLMRLHFVVLALLAGCIAAGLWYRLAIALFFIGFTYVELIDKATYLNHYYLVTLLCGLMTVLPANRRWSLDAWLRPRVATTTVPAWTVNILRFQVAVVYVFAGLAKLNADWLLDAEPMRIWLAARSDLPLFGPLLTHAVVAYIFSWAGAAYDLSIVFLLLWRRTRAPAYLTVVLFHVMTWLLFPIGLFPWIMIVATSIFFEPAWPRRWLGASRLDGPPDGIPDIAAAGCRQPALPPGPPLSRPAAVLLGLYVVTQIALPLRAYIPGTDSAWTYRGFNFAWRVMLVEKSGTVELTACDPATGRRWRVRLDDYITARQANLMAQDPFMVRALARHVAHDAQRAGGGRIEVHADAFAALNGGPAHRLIDPRVDLGGAATGWILPRGLDHEPAAH